MPTRTTNEYNYARRRTKKGVEYRKRINARYNNKRKSNTWEALDIKKSIKNL